MSNRKKRKNIKEILSTTKDLHQQITEAVAGLAFMSETDAEVKAFTGQETDSVTLETLLHQLGIVKALKIEEKDFTEFFEPLIKIQDWFGEDERKMTEKFVELKNLLQQNLISKKVFRLGKIDIDVFVVGLDKDNILRGIQTRTVET